jgi:hypothetical protein
VPLSDRTRALLHLLLWCGVFLTVAGLLQIVQPGWFDSDTSYHLAVGRLIRQHGILHGFPWTPFSVMADRYADTELLLHLTLAGLDIVVPAHAVGVAGTVLGALLLLTMMLLVGCLGYTVLLSQPLLARVRSRPRLFSEQAVAALNQAVPRDAQVFTCDWQLTGDMLLALPERRFMVALDPMLFYRKDRSRFESWQQLVRQGPKQPARIIQDRFGARFVLCEDNPAFFAFMRALRADPMAVLRLRAPPLTLFEIAPQKSGADANEKPTERQ